MRTFVGCSVIAVGYLTFVAFFSVVLLASVYAITALITGSLWYAEWLAIHDISRYSVLAFTNLVGAAWLWMLVMR